MLCEGYSDCFKGGNAECQKQVQDGFAQCKSTVPSSYPAILNTKEEAGQFAKALIACTSSKMMVIARSSQNPKCKTILEKSIQRWVLAPRYMCVFFGQSPLRGYWIGLQMLNLSEHISRVIHDTKISPNQCFGYAPAKVYFAILQSRRPMRSRSRASRPEIRR